MILAFAFMHARSVLRPPVAFVAEAPVVVCAEYSLIAALFFASSAL